MDLELFVFFDQRFDFEHSSVIYLRGFGTLWLLRSESIMQQKGHIIILLNTILRIWVMETPEVGVKNLGDSSPLMQSKGYMDVKSIGASVDQSIDVAGICNEAATLDQEDMVIDESNSGEPWVQGLMEGEYSDLSVEECLSAVVALIGIANEGNSIRIILEECLEAANALKMQMWAEVQLDKCRMKEEYVMKIQYPSYISDKTEPNVQISSVEGRQSPLPTHLHDAQNDLNYPIHMPSKRNPQIQEVSTCTDNLSLLQPGYAAERSWSQLKFYIGHKAEEMYVYRSLPLGQDRRQNRYWQFITSSSRNDRGSGRIFVELRHEDYEAMPILLLFLLFLLGRIIPDKLQSRRGPGLSATSREDYNIVESMEPDPPAGFCEQVSVLFAEWYRICELPGANDAACAHYVLQLQQNGLLNGDDLSDRNFLCHIAYLLSHQAEVFDSKAGAELLDIILKKMAIHADLMDAHLYAFKRFEKYLIKKKLKFESECHCWRGRRKMMMTGLHVVADVFCIGCRSILGLKYETAHEKSQKYNEGKSVLGCLIPTNGLQQEKVQYPSSSSSSSNGGQIGATTRGNHLSLSMNNNQQRPVINPPQLFATVVASSGFPQQITTRPQNWLHQKNGFYSLMRPS
ncbi:unnamed protein product [Camellia sinensis]